MKTIDISSESYILGRRGENTESITQQSEEITELQEAMCDPYKSLG